MTVAIEQPEYVVTAGQSVQLRASVAGGITPYKIHLEADDGSQATTLSATNILIPLAKPASTTVYTIRVQDSTPDSLSQEAFASTKVTVLPSSGTPSGSQVPTETGNTGGNNSGNQGGSDPTANTGDMPTEVTGNDESTKHARRGAHVRLRRDLVGHGRQLAGTGGHEATPLVSGSPP